MYPVNNRNRCAESVRNVRKLCLSVIITLTTGVGYSQGSVSAIANSASNDSLKKQTTLKRILNPIKVSGTLRMRYTASFENNIGIDGTHHGSDIPEYTSNAFTIPQARIVVAGDITKKMNVYVRVNFGDFAYVPQSRVLEYAFGTFNFNDYLNIRMGLFRPFFGREDDIATDFLKSFDYSNQYTAFSENGWVSYQLGLSLFGSVFIAETPLRYYAGVFNGNARINFSDNDNGKLFSGRLEADVLKNFRVGINGGAGKERGHAVSAWGADIYYNKDVSNRWNLELESEFKQGNNQALFFSQSIPGKRVGDYKMRGFYILPSLEYKLREKDRLGLEASVKYEFFDPDFKQNGNEWRQYVPMIGIDFAAQFAIRLQIGVVLDNYDRNIENTSQYTSGRFITQLQLRF